MDFGKINISEFFGKSSGFVLENGDRKITIGNPTPEYKKTLKSKSVLIVGTHPCYEADFNAANAYLQYDTAICAINEATFLVDADHIVTCHPERLGTFLTPFYEEDYTKTPEIHYTKNGQAREYDPEFERLEKYHWPTTIGASSAIVACAIMASIGYEQIILCGCPMDGGGGYALQQTHDCTEEMPRIGNMTPDHNMILSWQNNTRSFISRHPDLAGRVRSMSGFTKEAFGGLNGN